MARKDISMTADEITVFLEEQPTLQVATLGRGGFPHVAPMWFVLDEGTVAFRSFTKSQKIVNLTRDRRLTVLAEAGLGYSELRGVMIQGHARLVDDRDVVLDLYGRLAARYPMINDEPLDLDHDALEAAFGRFADKNTAVFVEPVKTISWDHRKIGGGY